MVLYMHFVAICLIISQGYGLHSYQSILNTEGRPILRSEMDKTQAASSTDEPVWMAQLRSRIALLVTQYGYDAAKPHIKKAVEALEKERGVLLDVMGDSRASYEYKDTLRSIGRQGKPNPEEEWVTHLKAYVKKLISQYGQKTLDHHLRPIIESLQNKNDVFITDIDVDTYGDISIKYKNDKNKKRNKAASRPTTENSIITAFRHRGVTQLIESF